MSPPRRYYYVEWKAARRHDLPNDRADKRRTFTKAEYAGGQVAALRRWIPSHVELVGVWTSVGHDETGITWEAVDPDELPVYPDVAERYRTLEEHEHVTDY